MKKFDKVFKHYDRFIELFNFNKASEIKDVIELRGDEVILDIGGGTGTLANYLSSACKLIYVLDESKAMLSKVKKSRRIIPVHADALDTGFDTNSIDIVIISDVLHHIEDQEGLIKEIYRVLKNKGKLIIMDFEKEHMKIKILRAFEYILFGSLYFRSSDEVINLIKERFVITKFIDNEYYFIIRGEKIWQNMKRD